MTNKTFLEISKHPVEVVAPPGSELRQALTSLFLHASQPAGEWEAAPISQAGGQRLPPALQDASRVEVTLSLIGQSDALLISITSYS